MNWLKNRLKERSTWLGIVTLATIAGVSLDEAQKEMVITIGTTVAALIATFTADKKDVAPQDWRAPDATQQQAISSPEQNALKE